MSEQITTTEQVFVNGELVEERPLVITKPSTPEDRIAQLEAQIAALLAAQQDG